MTEKLIIKDYCPVPEARPFMRPLLIAFGWLCVALGVIGAVTPGLPTTVFIIMAAWAFSRSSRRFHDWIHGHRMFGPILRNWESHRVIPKRAKILAVSMMTLSFVFVAFFTNAPWLAPVLMLSVMVPTAIYIVTRASYAPVPVKVSSTRR